MSLSGISSGAANEAQTLIITAISSEHSAISNPAISYASPNSTGMLTFAVQPAAFGTVTITVTIEDGQAANNSFSRSFQVDILPAAPPADNLIVNGSFESPPMPPAAIEVYSDGSTNVPGWVVLQGRGVACRMSDGFNGVVSTPFGETLLDLNSFVVTGNAIAQTFQTVPGGAYVVSFAGSREPWPPRGHPEASQVTLEVSVADVTRTYPNEFRSFAQGGMNWRTYSFDFVANSNWSTLTFRQTVGASDIEGACLDQVSVCALALNMNRDGTNALLSWPCGASPYVVQAATGLPANEWTTLTNVPILLNQRFTISVPATRPQQFFRLKGQ